MRVQIVGDVVPIFVVPTQSLLHNNNIGVTYTRTSNFRMELIKSIPLYFVAMLQSMITVIEAPFVLALVHIVVGIKSRPQIPKGRELVSFQEDISREVNIAFTNQPLDLGRGNLDPSRPLRPLGPFGLPMVNLGKPPLPPNIPYY
jgi:hypothetical protein